MFVQKLRDAIARIPAELRQTSLRSSISESLVLFRRNTDKFGYDALKCPRNVREALADVAGTQRQATNGSSAASEQDFVNAFLGPSSARGCRVLPFEAFCCSMCRENTF